MYFFTYLLIKEKNLKKIRNALIYISLIIDYNFFLKKEKNPVIRKKW